MVRIKNLQNLKRINQNNFRIKIRKILKLFHLNDKSISVVFCDNKFIKKLNRHYFKKNTSTDVISFYLRDEFSPYFLGEVIVSVEKALDNSKIYGTSWQREITLYIIHGILHLVGFKDYKKSDKNRMERKQKEILAYLYTNKRSQ